MAYAIKYRTSYNRRSGNRTTIDILENGYTGGTITNLIAGATPLIIKTTGDVNNLFNPSNGSGTDINILSQPLTLLDIFTVDPQKYIVKIYDGNSGSDLVWQGFINTGIYKESYSYSGLTPITLSCNDGMTVLENIPYYINSSTPYTGFTNVATVMGNIFSKLGLSFTTIRMSNDLLIADYSRNPFLYLTVNNENFYDEQGEPMDCRKVLNSIFQPLSLVMTLRGETIYLVDPINLHTTSKGYTYGTSPVYGYNETQQNLGGYLDLSNRDIFYYETGQGLDVIQPFNQLEIKYDPYNFTSYSYDFNEEGNADNHETWGTFTNDGTNYNIYSDVTMSGWTINGIYNFNGAQKSGTTADDVEDIDYHIKQNVSQSGSYEFTIPNSNIKQDENMLLELSFDIYVNTKHISNLWSTAAGTLVQEIELPFYIKVGNQWYNGGNQWSTTLSSFNKKIREPDSSRTQQISYQGWWLWKHRVTKTVDDSIINDTWINVSCLIDMGQSSIEDLINGSIHLYVPRGLDIQSITPSASEAQVKNVLLKNFKIEAAKPNSTPIGNDGVKSLYTIYDSTGVKKSKLGITLTNGCGTYGCSKAAFSTDQQVIQGINITGLMRDGSSTKYDTADLLGQNLLSQYRLPRIKLSMNLDVRNYLLEVEQKLIKDSRYQGSKAFYIVNGTYNDKFENFNCEIIELTSSRENIIT